ncbi:MAG: hypothetical protein H0A76_13450 [Candidatus Thiodubiliella endoseptemdiera]|uniref:Uncharacterized protein n=1 Tax=Candidatus Thiodubiliella endoseptemdiera TaxID=2738886 RepID=A0A853F429_9GAMM|nr:hypothetical protein [Candidatus Thiodubiliella endoseptemdiera]
MEGIEHHSKTKEQKTIKVKLLGITILILIIITLFFSSNKRQSSAQSDCD